MKLHFICPTVVHSHHSRSPFSPFTGAIHCAFFNKKGQYSKQRLSLAHRSPNAQLQHLYL